MRSSLRPALALAAATGIVAIVGSPSLHGYNLLGGKLGVGTTAAGYQRDVRVFSNVSWTANQNAVAEAAYPGALGAALAAWKGARAWASDNVLAARNFDFDWQGAATSSDANQNTIGWAPCADPSLAAWTQTPIVDGWRIVMCTTFPWSDAPIGAPFGLVDIQGAVAHELGHALGLAHSQPANCGSSCTPLRPTMCAVFCTNGTTERDIAPDDQAGLGALYGAIPASKPHIDSLGGSTKAGDVLVIHGDHFAPVVAVKFTAGTSQDAGAIPGVVFDVPTTGTEIAVQVPPQARSGNVLVWELAEGLLSNAFPIDVASSSPALPKITGISPSEMQLVSIAPVTLHGKGFAGATKVTVGGQPAGFGIVDDATITFGPGYPTGPWTVDVQVESTAGTSNAVAFTYLPTSPPQLIVFTTTVSTLPCFWTVWGEPNSAWLLLVGFDPSTLPLGALDVLANGMLLDSGALSDIGNHTTFVTVPASLDGSSFWSQAVTWNGRDLAVSGVVQTAVVPLVP